MFVCFFYSEPHYDVEYDHMLRGKEIVVQADTLNLPEYTVEQVSSPKI